MDQKLQHKSQMFLPNDICLDIFLTKHLLIQVKLLQNLVGQDVDLCSSSDGLRDYDQNA